MRSFLSVLITLSALAGVCFGAPVRAKDVAAGPDDIVRGVVTLPDPESLGVESRSALIRIEQSFEDGRWVWRERLDAQGLGARIAVLNADGTLVSASLVSDLGERVAVSNAAPGDGFTRSRSPLRFAGTERLFDGVALGREKIGAWTLEVVSDQKASGYALIDSGSGMLMRTHTSTLGAIVGERVALESSLSDGFVLDELRAFVRSPGGDERVFLADPGSVSLSFVPDQVGTHAVRVLARGTDLRGNSVAISTQHALVVHKPVKVLGAPTSSFSSGVVSAAFRPDERRVIIAAEVWGASDQGMTPVCFVSRVCNGERSLKIDSRWIARAGVDPDSLVLRSLRVHDADTGRPVLVSDHDIALGELKLDIEPDQRIEISDAMRTGRGTLVETQLPQALPTARGSGGGHRLMLVHGYCSDGNPFPESQFTGDIAVFSDPNASRSHDAFALEILAQTQGLKSFGVAAHSQGGMASLHLRTFYFSGLDWARGERLIQSVGTPYQGTALAGNAAVLGDLFGFGCGVNDSLTYDGAAAWLSLIPTWARQDVWYWTTSFEDRPLVYDFCNFITDLLLSDPDDGVVERGSAQLSGATNMGHLEGWCHTDGMRDPGQCTDASRNSEINERARR